MHSNASVGKTPFHSIADPSAFSTAPVSLKVVLLKVAVSAVLSRMPPAVP
jgi:hypothetical protein